MSQLVLVRCTKCKRRYAQHGDAGCPFCALDGTRTVPQTPKVVVRGDASVELVRPQPPRHATPPPTRAKPAPAAAPAVAGPSAAAAGPSAALDSAPLAAAAPVAPLALAPGRQVAADPTIVPGRKGAIVLRPSAPIRLGPIVLPRRVWMSIVALAILVAGSVAAWEVTQGDPDEHRIAAVTPPPPPSNPAGDEAEPDAPETQQPNPTAAPSAAGTEAPPAAAGPGNAAPAEAKSSAVTVAGSPPPGDARATPAEQFRQGTRYFMDSNLGAAQAKFEAAIALDPGYCAAHRALGVIHSTRQDGRRSVEAYQRYLQCSPRVADDAEIQRRITAFGGNASAAGDGR